MLKKILFFLMVLIILTGCSLTGGYDSSKAIKRGDITILHNGVHNLERFELFLEHLANNQEDTVRVTSYTKEGDPIFEDVHFDGKDIQYTHDNSQDAFGGQDKGQETDVCKNIMSRVNDQNEVEYVLVDCIKNGEIPLFQINGEEAKK
ncbi:DUF4362 domain-containing protein [Lysinibacillus pakistanensis]|uniref:DUF4362 domain-containing protein n=1 Tax=Lysinibacillus pakistanensis TaxID=759811 RepID=A0AAX3WZM4_9BACI|nr:DUF4362 domain-containing protein [Lysinibacillus pakistanensis]MDM5232351.1 DUF4362 domain-containing protein [Lysinibacillus pakistanensis]WHY47865.1 DUF4362 domain-containing protein [Lysinibacillus pakistanensis]WHY52877.1 DUF4362 domain-containing protein [Lysinibacillus pakistanensis]